MVRFVETLVIGGGPAGLTAAYKLSQQGHDVVVLEKDPVYVGGISRTVNYKNFLFDIGGHRFFSKSQAVVDLWNEILPDDFVERPRLSRIFYRAKFYAYPLRAFEALRNLGLWESIRCMVSFGYAQAFPVRNPATFHQWVAQSVRGAPVFDLFQDLYGKGLGHELRCHFFGLGGAAHQGPQPRRSHLDGVAGLLGSTGKSRMASPGPRH